MEGAESALSLGCCCVVGWFLVLMWSTIAELGVVALIGLTAAILWVNRI